jgi:hypothetical protein
MCRRVLPAASSITMKGVVPSTLPKVDTLRPNACMIEM